jgi:uncharacterized protein (DUF4415 family)
MKSFESGHGFTKKDWDAVDSPELTRAEIASLRPAREALPPAIFDALTRRKPGQRGSQKAPTKTLVSLRLDRDLVDALKAGGSGWQSRVNAMLRKATGT